ncbi:hypothetical protein PENSPDRAFT_659757 [Peniophora sp. CONT]|nr:hypothetical protein PENSPDRAFT_659757 [Peniophora sp. CONT]
MANEPFPFDTLKAETLRAMVRDLGANMNSVRTRDKMVSFLTAVQNIGHEAALEALKDELAQEPPAPKAKAASKKRGASPGPTTTAKRGRTRAATAEDAPPSSAVRGRAREPSAKAKEATNGNGVSGEKETVKKGGARAKAAPRARKAGARGKGKEKDVEGDEEEKKPKSKRGKAEVVISPRKKAAQAQEEEEEEEAEPSVAVDEDADGEVDVGNISAVTGLAAEAVVEEMLARGAEVEGGSAPMQVAVDVVTTVQAEPVAGPA